MNRGMAIIEFLIGFLVLTILVACFLRASLFEEENIRIEQAKQEFSQYKKDTTRTKEVIIDVIEDDEEEEEEPQNTPIQKEVKDRSLIPQFLEILD